MLGELVDCDWKPTDGEQVEPGQVIGWVEGFKAASDVYNVMQGQFAGGNPALKVDACIVRSDPYVDGWLYAIKGAPGPEHMDATAYIALLDQTIRRMAETTHAEPGDEAMAEE
jgi:glycine cleavage system H protein